MHLFAAVRIAVLLWHMVGAVVGGWMAWLMGMCVVWYVGECFRACGRGPCYFVCWYSRKYVPSL